MAVKSLSFRSPYRCGQRTVFTCLSIAQSANRVRARAKARAKREASDDRNAALDLEFFLRCPKACPSTAFLENRSTREIATYRVNRDRPTYVSYHLARLNGYRRCGGSGVSPGVPARTRSTFLRHQEPAECGKTRSRTGCVLAEAIASSKDLAERRAEREARVVASARLAQDRAATCPAACGPTTVSGDVAPTVRRVFVTRKLTQSQAPRYIAYYSAHWKVDLKCPAKPKDGGKGKKKKKERRKKR